jgi:hypothetical protein
MDGRVRRLGLGLDDSQTHRARRRRGPVGGVHHRTPHGSGLLATAGGGIGRGMSGTSPTGPAFGVSLCLRRMEAFKATTRPGRRGGRDSTGVGVEGTCANHIGVRGESERLVCDYPISEDHHLRLLGRDGEISVRLAVRRVQLATLVASHGVASSACHNLLHGPWPWSNVSLNASDLMPVNLEPFRPDAHAGRRVADA